MDSSKIVIWGLAIAGGVWLLRRSQEQNNRPFGIGAIAARRGTSAGIAWHLEENDGEEPAFEKLDFSKLEAEYDEGNAQWEFYGKATVHFKDGHVEQLTEEQLARNLGVFLEDPSGAPASVPDLLSEVRSYFEQDQYGTVGVTVTAAQIQMGDPLNCSLPHDSSVPDQLRKTMTLRIADHGWTPGNAARNGDNSHMQLSVVIGLEKNRRDMNDYYAQKNQQQIFFQPSAHGEDVIRAICQQALLLAISVLPDWIEQEASYKEFL